VLDPLSPAKINSQMNEDEQNSAGAGHGHRRSPPRDTTHSQIQNSPYSPAPLRLFSNNRQYIDQQNVRSQTHMQEQTQGQQAPLYRLQTRPTVQLETYQQNSQAHHQVQVQQEEQTATQPEILVPHAYQDPTQSTAQPEALLPDTYQREPDILLPRTYQPPQSQQTIQQDQPRQQQVQEQPATQTQTQAGHQRRYRYPRERHIVPDESDFGSIQIHEQGSNDLASAPSHQPNYNRADYPQNSGYEGDDSLSGDESELPREELFTGYGRPSPVENTIENLDRNAAVNLAAPSINAPGPEIYPRGLTTIELPWQHLRQRASDRSNATRSRRRHLRRRSSAGFEELGSTHQHQRRPPTQSEAIKSPPPRSSGIQSQPRSETIQLSHQPEQHQPEQHHHSQIYVEDENEEESSWSTGLEDAFRCNVGDENYPPSGEEDSDYYRQQEFSDHEEPRQTNTRENPEHSNHYYSPHPEPTLLNVPRYPGQYEHYPSRVGPANYPVQGSGQYNPQSDLEHSNNNHPLAGPSNYQTYGPGQELAPSDLAHPQRDVWAGYPVYNPNVQNQVAQAPAPPTPAPAAISNPRSQNGTPGLSSAPRVSGMTRLHAVILNELTGGPALPNDPRTIARKERREEKKRAREEKKTEREGGLLGRFFGKKKDGITTSQSKSPARDQTFPAERRLEAASQLPAHAGTFPLAPAPIAPIVRPAAQSPVPCGTWGPPPFPPPTGPLPRPPRDTLQPPRRS
jgi:hypothetical protein